MVDSMLANEGDKFPKNSEITLVVGKTSVNEKTLVPSVIGFNLAQARSHITGAMLNMGVVIYDRTILTGADTLNAKVFRQRPDPELNANTELGHQLTFG